MGKDSKIQWTDHTFNPWWGCVKVSKGCENCYAERQSARFGWDVWGLGKNRRKQLNPYWAKPYHWNDAAKKANEIHRVFSGSMCDIFEDNNDLIEERARLYETIVQTQHLEWLLLTKRPHNISCLWHWSMPPNVRLGVTVEDRWNAYKADQLLSSRHDAAGFFISIEPMLDPPWIPEDVSKLGWVIIGGESGPNARPFNVDAAIKIVRLCKDAGTPVFVKQMGTEWARDVGSSSSKGDLVEEWPTELAVREFPTPLRKQLLSS